MLVNTYRKDDRLLADLRNDRRRNVADPGQDYAEAQIVAVKEHDWFEVKLADGTPLTLHGTCLYPRSLRPALLAWYEARAEQRRLERLIARACAAGTSESEFTQARADAAEKVERAQELLHRGNPYWLGRP